MAEKYENKLPKGYYLVAIGFIVSTLVELLNTSGGDGQILIEVGFIQTYISAIGLTLFTAYIYNLSIYALMKNKLWGLIFTTSIALYYFCINIRYLNIQSFIFLSVFVYLMSVIIKKLTKYLEV